MGRTKKRPEVGLMRDKDVLSCLSCAKMAIVKLKGRGKPYDSLIDIIVGIGENDGLPTNSELSKKLFVSTPKLKQWIKLLYDDLLGATQLDPDFFEIKRHECFIIVKGDREDFSFSCRLPVIPRVGESVDFAFLHAKVGAYSFYVSDVHHWFVDDGLTIIIRLRAGHYNRHLHYTWDRARYDNEETIMSKMGMSDYALREELKKMYR